MKHLYKTKLISILFLSLFFISQNAIGQTIIFEEGFENATTMSYTNSTTNIGGLPSWEYIKTLDGRLKFDTASHTGSYSALLDNITTGTISINYLIRTIDMSSYTTANILKLNFFYVEYSDESSTNDKVWVRGSSSNAWLEIYNLNPSITSNNTWYEVSDLNISQTLSNSGQNFTSTFQIRFGQEDNFPYPSDGISYDDITITSTLPSLHITDIIHDNYVNYASANDSVGVIIKNDFSYNITSYSVNMTVVSPHGTSLTYTQNITDPIIGFASDTIYFYNVNFTQGGIYNITATPSTTMPNTITYPRTEDIEQAPFETPYSGGNTTYKEWWNTGNFFGWSGDILYRYFNNPANDSIITPAFKVTDDKLLFYYDANGSNLTLGDTIFVQIAQQGGAFVNFDTLYSGYYGYDTPIDLAQFNGQNIRVQYRVKTTTFTNIMFRINSINIVPYYYDFRVNDISYQNVQSCGSNSYPIKVQIYNNGNIPQSNTNIDVRVYGTIDTLISYTVTDQIIKGEYKWIEVGTIDATNAGNYEIIATVNAMVDEDSTNDIHSENIAISAPEPLNIDLIDNFTNYLWDSYNYISNANYLQTNGIYRDDSATTTTFRLGEITDNAKLYFDYFIYSQNNSFAYGNFLGKDDIFNVYIAEDINGTYTKVASMDSSSYIDSNAFQSFPEIDLASYIGKNIVVKFEMKNGADYDSTFMVQLSIDNLYIGIPEVDISLSSINTIIPIDNCCGGVSMFKVFATNNSRFDSYNVPLYFEYNPENGNEKIYLKNIDTLSANSSKWIYLDTVFNMTSQGNYYVNAYTDALFENNLTNDSVSAQYSVNEKKSLPYLEDFSTNFSDWDSQNFNLNNSNYLFTNDIYYNNEASIISPKFGEITSGSYLTFKYGVGTTVNGDSYLRDGDTIKVYISSDCGSTWDEVYNINHNSVAYSFTWQYINNIDLTAYQGQDIRAKIEFKKQNVIGHNNIYIGDFQVVTTGDAGIQSVSFPQHQSNISMCGTTNESAMVVVRNYGTGNLSSVPVQLNVVFGSDTTFINTQTGAINAGTADTIYISGFNTNPSGTYTVFAQSQLTDDINVSNDLSYSYNLITQTLHTMPYIYTGNNSPYDWQYFISDANSGTWNSDGNYIYTPLLDDGDTAYIATQKVGLIQANDELSITFKVNSYDQVNNYYNNLFRNNDELLVQISNDCGATFTTVATFNSTNYNPSINGDTIFVFPLDTYIGSELSVRLWVEKQSSIGKFELLIDEITFDQKPMPSVAISSVYFNDEICGNMNENVFAVISNPSNVDITDYNIVSYIKSNNSGLYIDTLDFTYSGTLEAGAIDTIIIGSFNSQLADMYYAESEVFMAGVSFGNNTSSFKIWDTEDYDYSTNFNGNYDGWKFDGAVYFSNSIYSNEVEVNRKTVAYSPKIEAIAPNSILEFNYYLNGGVFGLGDSINIYASTDCGSTYSMIGSVTNNNNLANLPNTSDEISLNAYTAQDVQFKIEFVNVNDNSYYMYFDNFAIISTDVKALGIVTETNKFVLANYNPNSSIYNYAERYITCGDAADNIFVVVENTGSTTIDTVNVSIAYNGKATGTLTGTYIGSLVPGAKIAVNINGTIDTETPGLVNMLATIDVDNDAVASNNTIGYSVTTQTVYPLPYSAFSGNHFNENYYWIYDDNANMSKSGSSSLSASGLSMGDTAYSISPKVEITNSNSYLFFGYAVSNSIDEGHITNNEYAEVLISSDCGASWTSLWYMDVTTTEFGASSMITADLSAYNGMDVMFKFRAIKGNSNGLFNITYSNIDVLNSKPAEITVNYSGVNHSSGSVFEEGSSISLSGNTVNSLNLTYEWMLENSDTSHSMGSGYNNYYTLTLADTGNIVLKVLSPNYNNVIATDTYAISVCETPEITLTFNNESRPSNSYFCEGDAIDLSFNSNSDLNLTYNWNIVKNGDSTAIGTGANINYTLTANDDGIIILSLINPMNNFLIATASYNINVCETPIIKLMSENVEYNSGATFCEGIGIDLSFNSNSNLALTYEWIAESNGNSVLLGTGTTVSRDLLASDAGVIKLYIYSQMYNKLIVTESITINVNTLPTKPTISGDNEVLSNVKLSEYTATGSFADQYIWDISNGGFIAGNSIIGSVNWDEGYIGYAMISATGYNACGMGTTSNDYLVYVEYLDPIAGDDDNKGDNSKANTNDEFIINTYPNPNNGVFSLELPVEVDNFEIQIKNSQGLLINMDNVVGNKTDISLGKRVPGLYYIQIMTNDNVYSKTFIIY